MKQTKQTSKEARKQGSKYRSESRTTSSGRVARTAVMRSRHSRPPRHRRCASGAVAPTKRSTASSGTQRAMMSRGGTLPLPLAATLGSDRDACRPRNTCKQREQWHV